MSHDSDDLYKFFRRKNPNTFIWFVWNLYKSLVINKIINIKVVVLLLLSHPTQNVNTDLTFCDIYLANAYHY